MTFTARTTPGPPLITAWIDRDGSPVEYADQDPATGAPWADEAQALAWAQAEAEGRNAAALDALVIESAVLLDRAAQEAQQ